MFNNAKEVIQILRQNTIDYKDCIILGAGDLGLERFIIDLNKVKIAYEWADDKVEFCKNAGVNCVKEDITELETIEADIVTFFDILEHFTKEDALNVLKKVKAKQILMFIPIQDKLRRPDVEQLQQEAKANNKQMTQHLSLWTPKELEELGFKVWYKDKYFGANHNNWGAAIAIKTNV